MKIAVLISGGVDSAVVVHKLFNEGHELHLFYILIGMDNEISDCSSEEDIEMCQLIAKKYNLPFEVVSLQDEYWNHVMKYSLEGVKKGLTPHPDMMCNKLIKFGFFEERWGKDFDKTATGHYAAIRETDKGVFMGTSLDAVKDQTDFLSQISYSQLCHLLFPLGDMTKEEVRLLAKEIGLPNASRKDSQGICFLGKIDYPEFLKSQLGEKKGDIIELETNKKIGEHKGFWYHTIGQRKGLGLGGGPWFVVKKDIDKNIIYVSHGYETPKQYGRTIWIDFPHWINPMSHELLEKEGDTFKIAFKTRHTPEFHYGKLIIASEDFRIESETDIQGIAPGQFVTFYTPDRKICLGSAQISIRHL